MDNDEQRFISCSCYGTFLFTLCSPWAMIVKPIPIKASLIGSNPWGNECVILIWSSSNNEAHMHPSTRTNISFQFNTYSFFLFYARYQTERIIWSVGYTAPRKKYYTIFFLHVFLPPPSRQLNEWQKRYGPIGASINQKMLDFAFFGIATLTGSILRLIFLLHFLCSDMWKRFSAKRSSHDNTQYSIEPSKKAADMILYVQDKLYSWYKGDLDTTLNGSKEITVWKLKRPSQNSKAKICPQDYGFYL